MFSKHQLENSEEGYFSGPSTGRTLDLHHDFSTTVHDDSYPVLGIPEKYFYDNMPHSSSLLDPIPYGMEHKGILFDRLKEAQDTIEQLSTKLYYCEDEISLLNQRKQAFEAGFFKLEIENKCLLTDRIIKEKLLQKVNDMGVEVSELLNTQQRLLSKHQDQEKSSVLLKMKMKLLEEENTSLKVYSDKLAAKSDEQRKLLDEVKVSHQEFANKLMIVRIEKEALSSEYNRIVQLHHESEEENRKLHQCCKEMEQKSHKNANKIESSENSISNLKEQNMHLQSELQVIMERKLTSEERYSEEISQLKKQNEVIVSTNEILKKELFLKKEICDEQKSNIDELNSSNVVLKCQSIEIERQYRELLVTNSVLEKQVLQLTETIEKDYHDKILFSQKLSVSESEKEKKEKQLQKLKAKSEVKIKEFEIQICELDEQSMKMKESYLLDKQKIKIEYESKLESLESSKNITDETNTQLGFELKTLKDKYFALDKTLCTVRKETSDRSFSQSQDVSQLTCAKAQLTEKCQALTTMNIQYMAQTDEYASMLHNMKTKHHDLKEQFVEKVKQMASAEKQIKILEEQIDDMKIKNKRDIGLIESLQKQSKSEVLSERNRSEDRIQLLEKHIKDTESQLKCLKEEKQKLKEEHDDALAELLNKQQEKFEKFSNEKMELQVQCRSLQEKVTLYASMSKDKKAEVEKMSSTNSSQQMDILKLRKQLEILRKELNKITKLEHQSKANKENADELEFKVTLLTKENEKLTTERKDSTTHTRDLLDRLNAMAENLEKQSKQMKDDKDEYITKEQKYKKELHDVSYRNEKLKSELRQRTLQKHSACGEIEIIKSDNVNVKKELTVIIELNKKLEEVSASLQEDNEKYRNANEQLQRDVQMLKSSFEDLLATELEKQRSEFLQKENELLKKLSIT